jgi:hypothetical protein
MTKLGDMFHIPVTDRLNKRRPCVQKTIGRSGTLFCHFLLILVGSGLRARFADSCCMAAWLPSTPLCLSDVPLVSHTATRPP